MLERSTTPPFDDVDDTPPLETGSGTALVTGSGTTPRSEASAAARASALSSISLASCTSRLALIKKGGTEALNLNGLDSNLTSAALDLTASGGSNLTPAVLDLTGSSASSSIISQVGIVPRPCLKSAFSTGDFDCV